MFRIVLIVILVGNFIFGTLPTVLYHLGLIPPIDNRIVRDDIGWLALGIVYLIYRAGKDS